MPTRNNNGGPQNLKRNDSPPRGSLQEILQQGSGSSSAPSRGAGGTDEPAVEISAKGREEPVVKNLPKITSRTLLSGVSSSDIPLQEASSSSAPAEGEALRYLASGAPPSEDKTIWMQ
jgi:hypothetical protein